MSRLLRHPGDEALSLFAGGDLGRARRYLIGRHVRHCRQCRAAVEAYQLDREKLRAASPVPDVDFRALAHRVRVAAATERSAPSSRGAWGWAAAAGCAVVAVIALTLPTGTVEETGPGTAAMERSRPAGQMPALDAGLDTQVTADGSLSVRAFHPGTGTMTITEYYAP